ncbi:twin-arginine translocase subunit TatC [Microbacterium sp. EYE_5]|uniref:twin-arginine translocase subunit TatC n=1 Tax=unclassified Microbacterium TaxID=2609290 RepID=UPI002006352C|nr:MULTISPECIES: twin-arginine translocase subunit TatC [unclassified Microbacterium]MCK6080553.1 twin-arginine translocase subunit TatC [Microbacterium sp. EYE_382]MCK6085824.1 twin-arginine translocase subunit TatC [Microbacterium sp. EYE_384]MCK6124678.1 twin-arginine translocase subunit TatC [Microbacterium sp. EYE_80]MCK6127587.1 twin-arginine translocase subunit TatC [Microbacterium sp. EYE_79]MCK6141508.1 twin-arginine translocase subunit TatC [Microbacterium sp. EYE_39]
MTLGDHLREFRKRVLIAAAALVVGMIVSFILTDGIIWAMTEPIRVVAERRGDEGAVTLMFATVTSAFDLRIRIAFAVGLLLSAPVWLWQIWAFLMPGLTRKEVRYTVGFVAAAVPLFFSGAFFGWIMLPHLVELMAGFTPTGASNFYDAKYYYDFTFKLLLVVGVSFVTPVFLVALNLAGVMTGREIMKGWRVAIVIATVFAGAATPAADVVSMLVLAVILTILFFAAAGLSMLFDRRRGKREAALLGSAA